MSLSVQFISLLVMIGTGIIAGAIIDHFQMLNIARHTKRSARLLYVSIEVMVWILVGCWTFYVLYKVRDGAWRIYDPLAQLSGLFLYMSFFYKPIRLMSSIVYMMLIRPILLCMRIVWKVIKVFLNMIKRPFIFLYRLINRIFSRIIRNPF